MDKSEFNWLLGLQTYSNIKNTESEKSLRSDSK